MAGKVNLSFKGLPPELLGHVLAYVDTKAASTSRCFAAAQEQAFFEHWENFQKSPKLAGVVRLIAPQDLSPGEKIHTLIYALFSLAEYFEIPQPPCALEVQGVEEILDIADGVETPERNLCKCAGKIFQRFERRVDQPSARANLIRNYMDRSRADLARVRKLVIPSAYLRKFPDELLSYYPNLQDLFIDESDIKALPASISAFPGLLCLSLANNELIEISPAITRLELLLALHLQKNRLAGVPEDLIHLKALRYLDLSFNFIEDIPDPILEGLSKLGTCDLSSNPLNQRTIDALKRINSTKKYPVFIHAAL